MSSNSSTRSRKWPKRVAYFLIGLVAIWFAGDLGYSTYVSVQIDEWERSVSRGEDGVQLGCEPFEVGSGNSAILFIHGINDSPYIWRKIAPEIATSNFTCYAMRLPGFAEPIRDYAATDHHDWIEAVELHVDRLSTNHERIYIVAHSLGCAITLAYLQEQADRVNGIVLIAPAIQVAGQRSPIFPPKTWHQIGNRLLFFTDTTMSPFGLDVHDPDEKDDEHITPFTPRHTIDETFFLIDHNKDFAEKMQNPLLMVISPDDAVIDSEAAEAFFDASTSEPKRLFKTSDSGHSIPVDLDWQDVTEEIKGFLGHLEETNPLEVDSQP